MESKLESGSFLRQIDEIKQELDFGNDFTEQDYLDEYKPLTDEMDPKFCSDNIEKDILKILNSNETNGKDYSDFCEEMSIRTMRAPSGKLAIVERLGKLLTGKGDRTSSEPANLLGEMEQQGLKDTAAYRKLFEQVDLLKEAEDRLRSLLDLLSQENRLMADHQFDSTKPRDIKLRLVLNESSKRINLDRITNEMLFLERLPKNSIFSTINTSYGIDFID